MRAADEHTSTVTVGADRLDLVLAELVALGADFTLDADGQLREQVRAPGRRLLEA